MNKIINEQQIQTILRVLEQENIRVQAYGVISETLNKLPNAESTPQKDK